MAPLITFLYFSHEVQTKQWLDKCYGESSPLGQIIEKWINEFKQGCTSTNDAERSGKPKDVTTLEIIRKVHDILLDNLKVKVRELAEATSISIGSVVKILYEDLGMRMLAAKWVPRLQTIDQKRQRVRDLKSCLDFFHRNPSDFLRRLVIIHENWI